MHHLFYERFLLKKNDGSLEQVLDAHISNYSSFSKGRIQVCHFIYSKFSFPSGSSFGDVSRGLGALLLIECIGYYECLKYITL